MYTGEYSSPMTIADIFSVVATVQYNDTVYNYHCQLSSRLQKEFSEERELFTTEMECLQEPLPGQYEDQMPCCAGVDLHVYVCTQCHAEPKLHDGEPFTVVVEALQMEVYNLCNYVDPLSVSVAYTCTPPSTDCRRTRGTAEGGGEEEEHGAHPGPQTAGAAAEGHPGIIYTQA